MTINDTIPTPYHLVYPYSNFLTITDDHLSGPWSSYALHPSETFGDIKYYFRIKIKHKK